MLTIGVAQTGLTASRDVDADVASNLDAIVVDMWGVKETVLSIDY